MPKIQALLFDLDDTLVDSEAAYRIGMRAIGIENQDPIFLKARNEVKARLGLGAPASRSRNLYFKRYLEIKDEYTARRHFDMISSYEKSVSEDIAEQWQALERDRLFSFLCDRFPLFIVTNETLRMQTLKLLGMDPMAKYFSRVMTSEEAGVEKPARRIFEMIIGQGFRLETCCMIGDSNEKDIVPARELGCFTVRTVEFTKDVAKGSEHRCVSNLNQLQEVLIDFEKMSHLPLRDEL